MRSAIPCNITIANTVALVSCLARLHNFCIDEVERTQEYEEEALPLDLELMMNGLEGYVRMVKVKVMDSNQDVPIPKDIIDGSNHFDDCTWAARQS